MGRRSNKRAPDTKDTGDKRAAGAASNSLAGMRADIRLHTGDFAFALLLIHVDFYIIVRSKYE